MNTILKAGGALMLAALLCQCSSEAPPRAGSLRQVDPKAEKYMAQAKQEEANNRPKKAIKRYEDIVDDCPMSLEAPYARFRKAQLHEQVGDPMDAFDEYQKLIENYPDSPYYTQALNRQKELAFAAGRGDLKNKVFWTFDVSMDPSIVTKWLNSVCDNAPFAQSAPEAKKVLGDYLSQRGMKDEAIAAYQSIVDNYPHSTYAPEAQLRVAALYANSKASGDLSYTNVTKAQEAYEEFLMRYPNIPLSADARDGLARVRQTMVQRKLELGEYYLNRMKDRDAALFCFEEVVASGKNNPEAAKKAKEYLARLKAPQAPAKKS